MKGDLNIITKIVLCLIIIRHAIQIIRNIQIIQYADNDICIYQIIMGILMIVVLIGILRIKKQALYSFFILQLLNSFIIWDMKYRIDDYFVHLIVAIFFSAIMAGLLFLKKNGISGWKLINNN